MQRSAESPNNNKNIEPSEKEIMEYVRTNEIIPIRCGTVSGLLHKKLFVCPGLHEKCIKMECVPNYMSPVEFTVRGDKYRQKDWKGSIRIGKIPMRKLMDLKIMDFHDHSNNCTAKCVSRNFIAPKEDTPIVEMVKERILRESLESVSKLNEGASTSQTSPAPSSSTQFRNAQVYTFVRSNNTSTVQTKPPTTELSTEEAQDKYETDQLFEKMTRQPAYFWGQMKEMGLADSIISDMIVTLNFMRYKLKNGGIPEVAQSLSQSIAALGTCEHAIAAIRLKQTRVDRTKHGAYRDPQQFRVVDQPPQSNPNPNALELLAKEYLEEQAEEEQKRMQQHENS